MFLVFISGLIGDLPEVEFDAEKYTPPEVPNMMIAGQSTMNESTYFQLDVHGFSNVILVLRLCRG